MEFLLPGNFAEIFLAVYALSIAILLFALSKFKNISKGWKWFAVIISLLFPVVGSLVMLIVLSLKNRVALK